MKNVRSLTRSLLCASLCLVCGLAEAQQPAARQAAPASASRAAASQTAPRNLLVAVIDMRAVLERHPGVADKMPALVERMKAEEQKLMQARQAADKEVAGVQAEFEVGSQEYTDRVNNIRKTLSDATFAAQGAQDAIVAERTKILYQAYVDVQEAIKTVAQANGVLIVHSKIKFDAAGKIPEEVAALQEADSNPIVWNRPECDITEAVIKQLAAKVGEPKTQAPAQGALSNLGQQAMQAASGAPASAAPRAVAPNAAPRR
ncbi:MAG: OmpH family outer membrane protein [Thermoguttaceae bacterium]|nr:OmpH family outer membrane protein [Thermoguttaceae bacterium]